MNPEIKQEWIKRLRSGEYDQTTSYLRAGNKFCCLGVLCEIAVDKGIINSPVSDPEASLDSYIYLYDGNSGVLPDSVRKWAGIDETKSLDVSDLVVMNDGERKTFDEIAVAIENSF